MSKSATSKVYGYRWVVLLVFMFVAAVTQILWITFAPISSYVAGLYSVTDLDVALLSMIFMIVYLPVSIPSAYIIDSKGFRIACSVGAIITALFAVLRAFAPSYLLLFVFQAGIAVGQPFVFNSPTKLARRWFPAAERGLATGLGTMAIFLGIALGLLLTPIITFSLFNYTIMQYIYALIAVIAAVLFIVVAKERPATPPQAGEPEEEKMTAGLRRIVSIGQFVILEVLFFVGMGIFNGIATWIEQILSPRFSPAFIVAGIIGAVMIFGGIIGAVIIPALSDKFHRRKPFILLSLGMAMPLTFVLAYHPDYNVLLVASFLLGFFLMPSLPLGLQAGAELTAPTPEGTSAGVLMIFGQLGGIVLILLMDQVNSMLLSFFWAMMMLVALNLLAFLISFLFKETAKKH